MFLGLLYFNPKKRRLGRHRWLSSQLGTWPLAAPLNPTAPGVALSEGRGSMMWRQGSQTQRANRLAEDLRKYSSRAHLSAWELHFEKSQFCTKRHKTQGQVLQLLCDLAGH